jgi:glycosyltransferase involved in cell wall biosynthesis
VYPSFISTRGGVERYIEGLTKHLSLKGHTTKILTLENEYCTLMGKHSAQAKSLHTSSLSTICNEHFDIIHTHGFRVPFSSLIGFFRKMKGDNIVMTVHTFFPYRSNIDAFFKNFYDLTLGNIALKTFDGFIAINSQIQSKLKDLGVSEEKVTLITNSVDISRFRNLPSKELFLENVGVAAEEKIVLTVGRIDWQKGIDKTIKAFAGAQKVENKVKLVIVGKDYGYQDYLFNLTKKFGVSKNVIFAGELSDELLYSAYASAKVLLMTSIYEGFPTVLLEGMASGLPVISTPIRGVSEIIPNYSGVVWCERSQLEEKLVEVLSDESLRKKLSKKAVETVEKDFSWEKNSEKILNVYNSV